MAVENSGNVTVAWNGSGIFSVCQYACGNTAVGFELSGISGIYGPADGRKTNVVPDLIYGNHSTACRGNRFSLADLSETSGLYANSSGNILTDKLPKHADVYDYNYYEKIAEKEFTNNADNNTQIVNTYDALKKLSKDYIYYKTDHHWTTKGAFIAYNEFCKAAGIESEPYENLKMKNVTDKFYGTLYSKVLDKKKKGDSIEIAENIPQCNVMINGKKSEIYHIDKLKEKDKYQVFFGGNYGVVSIENNEANNDKNLLIIKDSYANSFTPFLLKDYKTITIVDYRYFSGNLQSIVQSNNITDVLVLYEMSNFMKDKNLVKMMF